MPRKPIAAAVLVALGCAVGLTPATVRAQDDLEAALAAGRWGTRATVGVNLLQSYYTRNWNGGDKGSVVWNATLDAVAQRRFGDDWDWFNSANLAFGQNHQQDRDADDNLFWRRPDKSTDQIKLESLMRYTDWALPPYSGVRFSSQFLDQSDPSGRDFTFNPMEYFLSAGVSRMLIENDDRRLLTRLGFTYRLSQRDQVGDEDAVLSESSTDGGLELVVNYDTSLLQGRVEYRGQLRAYKALFYSAKDDVDGVDSQVLLDQGLNSSLSEDFMATDIDFENNFKASITRLVNVQFNLRWVYDKYDTTVKPVVGDVTPEGYDDPVTGIQNRDAVHNAVRKSGQLRQTMSIGLAYTF
jgi:hypothetical protein